MSQYFAEFGKTGINWSQGYIYEDFLTSLVGQRGVQVYREMSSNDAIIGAVMFAIKQILKEVRWATKPYDESSQSKKDADFLRTCMYNPIMQTSWTDFISNVLSMLEYGWSWFEMVFVKQDGKLVWRKFAPRAANSLERWDVDVHGDITGLIQRPPPSFEEIQLPKWKCLHFRTEDAGGNPEGRSILRNAYRSWYLKKNLEELEAVGIERDLVGLPMLYLPEGIDPSSEDDATSTKIASAKTLISRLRRDEQEGVLVPHGWKLELLQSPGNKQFNTTEVINRYNKQMAVTTLAQFIMLGMERTGSYALAGQQTDMFYLCLEGWANSIASTFNRQAVPLLFKLNGNTSNKLPYIVHTPVHHITLNQMAVYISQLVKAEAIEITDEVKNYLKRYARLEEFSEVSK